MKNNSLFGTLRAAAFGLLLMAGASINNTASAQDNSEVPADVRTEIEQLNKQIGQDYSSGQIANIVDLFSDNATIIAPGGKKIQGRKAIAEYWYAVGKGTIQAEISELGGNSKLLYEIGKWTITTTKDGVETKTTSDVMIVWKRGSDYSYKIQLTSFNNAVATTLQTSQPFEASTK